MMPASYAANAPRALVSPQVHPDKSVTFRLAAPNAAAVTFTGDWLSDTPAMTREADGTWSITLGPLPPSTYIYSFTVDGVAMADPVNPRIKLRDRGSGSLVDVLADSPTVQELRDVPHGAVELNLWKSASLNGETHPVYVYTPPGYSADTATRYPVLYLLHGANDTAAGWVTVGNANIIEDNLIALKQAVPMIIVMPFGYALPYGQPTPPGRNNTQAFEQYLFSDLIPQVEAKYRVAPGRRARAIAGMSMGAEQSLYLFFHHFDQFSSIGAFCPSSYRELATSHAALLADAAGTNAQIDVLWIGCGRQDPAHFPGSQQVADVLAAHNINHIWHPTEGMHNYALWRDYLVEFLPLVFHPAASSASAVLAQPTVPAH